MRRRWLSLGLAVTLPLLGAAVAGCTVSSEPVPVAVIVPTEPAGTLVVDWTIELRADPADCLLTGADAIRIRVSTVTGFDAGTFEQACAAFATSIALAPGTYSATAQLVDAAGVPRTTAVGLGPFTLFGNDVLRTPIDFPTVSFF